MDRHMVEAWAMTATDNYDKKGLIPAMSVIRELENFVERSVILTRGSVLKVPLAELKELEGTSAPMAAVSTLEGAEREHILRVLKEARGVVGGPNGAAARLGLKRTTLISKMQRLGIYQRGNVANTPPVAAGH